MFNAPKLGFVIHWYTEKCNKVTDISITSWRQVEQPIIFLRIFALASKIGGTSEMKRKRVSLLHSTRFALSLHRGSRENHSSHWTFRPHTDVGNSSVSHQWIRIKSQNWADDDGTKMGETGYWKGETSRCGNGCDIANLLITTYWSRKRRRKSTVFVKPDE